MPGTVLGFEFVVNTRETGSLLLQSVPPTRGNRH